VYRNHKIDCFLLLLFIRVFVFAEMMTATCHNKSYV